MSTWTPKQFADHLATVGVRVRPEVARTMNKAAMNIQHDWFMRARRLNPPGSASSKYPSTIIKTPGRYTGAAHYTIGVETANRGQGKLGVILEYGGGLNAPQRSNVAAAAKEIPELRRWLAKIAAEAI